MYSAAQSYDTQFTTIINSKGQKRTLYQHETDSYENNEEYEHHFDTNIKDLIINFTNFHVLKQTQKHTRLTPSQWHDLSSESQQTYDQLDNNSKSIILTSRQIKINPPYRPNNIRNQRLYHQYTQRENLHE